jgi:hypothetical protein
VQFVMRPLPAVWPNGQRTPEWERRKSPFRSTRSATLGLLEVELYHLEAEEPIVLAAGYHPWEIRLDGLPRANAKPHDPAVILSFEGSAGPMQFACDTYDTYDANLRAVALTLEALRAVERYGATQRHQQYTGWLALPPGGMSRQQAEAEVRKYAEPGATLEEAFRRGAKAVHPGRPGGDSEAWARLDAARRVLGL